MFIFIHEPIYDTTWESTRSGNGWSHVDTDQSTHLKDILNGHPEIVLFSGHNHYSFGDTQSDYYRDFGDDNTHYFLVPSVAMSQNAPYNYPNPQGYHVSVDSDYIEVDCVEYTGSRYRIIKDPIIINHHKR